MFKSKRRRPKFTFRIIPLIDTIFILFVFFVISATFSKLPGININRPEAKMADTIAADNLQIGISVQGEVYYAKQKISLAQLLDLLRAQAQKKSDTSILIVADKETPLKFVVQVMDVCREAGIVKIAIANQAKD